jgi:membrane associated rhomboid family serine protease
MRCPDCAREKTKVRTAANLSGTDEPRVVYAIIAACVVSYLALGPGDLRYALFGPAVQSGEYYRLVTSAFMHGGLLHIGFNMYLLYIIGRELELGLGSPRFASIYATALLWGSMGALAQTTTSPVVGASGAVFGVVGAMMVELRRRGMDPFSGGLGGLVLLNFAIGFLPGLNIAWGGHVGGFIGGALAALAFDAAAKRRLPWLGFVLCAVLSVVAVAGAIVFSQSLHDFL